MTARRLHTLSILQWCGILVGALVWTAQHVVGFGIADARCHSGGAGWGIDNVVWQLTLVSCAGLAIVGAEVCAVLVFREVQGADYGDGPPEEGRFGGRRPYGRLAFFSSAAMVSNVLFLVIMLLASLSSALNDPCAQS